MKQRYEATLAGKPYPTPSSTCWPMVAPLIYRVQEMQFLQTKDEVTIVYMQDHEVRRVRLNAQHPAKVTPTWHGDSVGHYEGDTLVVDTVGMKVGPVNVIDQAGSPYSEALHVVERYRLIDYEAAKEGAMTAPKGAPGPSEAAVYRPQLQGQGAAGPIHGRGQERLQHAMVGRRDLPPCRRMGGECLRREPNEYYNGRDTALPRADKPDF